MAKSVATAVSTSIFGQISSMVTTAEMWLIDVSASWWVMVPSISLYPDANNTNPDAAPIDAVANLHALIMPITLVVAVGGMLWNGLLMVLSRKPAPLLNVMRGLWNTALWAAVGVFGTQLLLAGSDAFSTYVITTALKSVGNPSFGKRLSSMVVPVTGHPGGLPIGLVMLIGSIAMVCAFVQAILMLFRDGSVLILAAVTPLAAAGSFTNATNGWKNKIVSWQLALIFYKPLAAIVYAVSIWLTGENNSTDLRVLLFGMAMMVIALIALPVLMRFFSWTVGSLQGGGGGFGMFATAGAAGVHAAASLRGTGPMGVNEHARYIANTFGGASAGGPSGGGSAPPNVSATPGSPPPAPSGGSLGAVPRFQGSPGVSGPGGAAPGRFPMPAPTAKPQGAARDGEGREGSQAVMGVVNAGTGVVEGVAPLAGPAAPVVQGAAQVVRTGAQMADSAANSLADAASESTKDGGE
jgi:hypothetical protein